MTDVICKLRLYAFIEEQPLKSNKKIKKKNRFISKWLIQNTNPKELYTVHPLGCPVLYHLENTECYLQPQSTKFGSASLGVGRTAGGTLGHLLARALSFSPLKAEIPRISDSWQKGWGWGGGKKPGGVFYSPHQSPHLRIYHCLTLLPLRNCAHKPPNKVSPLRVRQGISPGIERMGAALSRHLYHPMSR